MKSIIYTLIIISLLSCNFKEKDSIGNQKKIINNSVIKDIEKYYQDDYGKEFKLFKTATDSVIDIYYKNIPINKDDYVGIQMRIEIPKKGKGILYGDLNNDKIKDIIVTVNTQGGGAGGNVWWNDIFVFLKKGDKYSLSTVNTNWDISGCDRGFVFIEEIKENIIKGTSSCYSEDDGRCCPSLTYETRLQLLNNKIVTINKQQIKKQ